MLLLRLLNVIERLQVGCRLQKMCAPGKRIAYDYASERASDDDDDVVIFNSPDHCWLRANETCFFNGQIFRYYRRGGVFRSKPSKRFLKGKAILHFIDIFSLTGMQQSKVNSIFLGSLRSASGSVTRFGEIYQVWQNCIKCVTTS